MQVEVDPDLCISCGMCVSIEPDIFQFNDEDKAQAVGDVTEENRDNAQTAVDSCPVGAIHW